MPQDIKIRVLTGNAIKTYIPSIMKVRSLVLQEFPYLSHENHEVETKHLKRLSQSKESIAVVVFDSSKIIGVSTGLPLEEELPILQRPIVERKQNPADYYYFEVSALLKEYRGRGIAHHLFDLRESHVKNLKKYKKICFTHIVRPQDHHCRPLDYTPLDNFWKKRGYVEHKDMVATFPWKEINEKEPSHKPLTYWIKEITS